MQTLSTFQTGRGSLPNAEVVGGAATARSCPVLEAVHDGAQPSPRARRSLVMAAAARRLKRRPPPTPQAGDRLWRKGHQPRTGLIRRWKRVEPVYRSGCLGGDCRGPATDCGGPRSDGHGRALVALV
jgi:hypothetical protein